MTELNTTNNWFYQERVTPSDMKLITKTMMQLVFCSNGGLPSIVNCQPTINGGDVSITIGFAYFGETSDSAYINNTGTNQLNAFVLPQNTTLINSNCFLYIKPVITSDINNRTSTVTGVLYSSINDNDEGIKLATVEHGNITAINSINPTEATNLQRGVVSLKKLDETYASLTANQTFTGENNFANVLKKKGYNVATYNAGINNVVYAPGPTYTVTLADANTNVVVQSGSIKIVADAQTANLPLGFNFDLEVVGLNTQVQLVLTGVGGGTISTTYFKPSFAALIYNICIKDGNWFIGGLYAPGVPLITAPNFGSGIVSSGSDANGTFYTFAQGLKLYANSGSPVLNSQSGFVNSGDTLYNWVKIPVPITQSNPRGYVVMISGRTNITVTQSIQTVYVNIPSPVGVDLQLAASGGCSFSATAFSMNDPVYAGCLVNNTDTINIFVSTLTQRALPINQVFYTLFSVLC